MKYYFSFFIFLVAFLCSSFSKGNPANMSPPELLAVCDIIVEDSLMLQDAFIRFEMSINEVNTSLSKQTRIHKKKINSKRTRLSLPLSTPLNYGRISFLSNGKEQPFNYGNNLFLFQDGDTIQIYLDADRVEFRGKSADKFTCMYRIQESIYVPTFDKVHAFLKQSLHAEAIKASKQLYDSLFTASVSILNEYRGKIDRNVRELILLDCKGSYDYSFAGYLSMLSNSRYRREILDEVKRALIGYFPKAYYEEKNPELLVQSYWFSYFLLNKEIISAKLRKSSPADSRNQKYTFRELFSSIQANYSGIILDKLLLDAFYLNINHRADSENYLDSALNTMGNSRFRSALQAIKERNVGSDAFPFELEDEKGKIYRLSDFEGKLVIMHFWFTGCHGCAGLAKHLKPIIESYRSNPKVAFITVNVDKGKESWIKSLKTEKYTSKEEINLYAGGGHYNDHPMLKYYNIIGFPTVIFISKEGNIITTSPPRPFNVESVKAFKDLINKNL